MVFHISALSVPCKRGAIMVFGRKHFLAVKGDSQSLSGIEGLLVGLPRKWKTILQRVSWMKCDLQRKDLLTHLSLWFSQLVSLTV